MQGFRVYSVGVLGVGFRDFEVQGVRCQQSRAF